MTLATAHERTGGQLEGFLVTVPGSCASCLGHPCLEANKLFCFNLLLIIQSLCCFVLNYACLTGMITNKYPTL